MESEGTKFNTITGEDWRNAMHRAGSEPNLAYEKIKMKLHPQNPTPGESVMEEPRPVTANELFEILELLADGLERSNQNSYYYGAAKRRIQNIKKRL